MRNMKKANSENKNKISGCYATHRGKLMNTVGTLLRCAMLFAAACLISGQVLANGEGSIYWENAPATNTAQDSGKRFITNMGVYSRGAGASQELRATGSCSLYGEGQSNVQQINTSGNPRTLRADVYMRAGDAAPLLTRCTIRGYQSRGNGSGSSERDYLIRQSLTINNPGPRNDSMDDDETTGLLYKVTASAMTTDGRMTTLGSEGNVISFTIDPSTAGNCTIESTDPNAAYIRNNPEKGGEECQLNASVSGNIHLQSGVTASERWEIINTRVPKLELLSPPSTGVKPQIVYSSSLESLSFGVTIIATEGTETTTGVGCAGPARTAVEGRNRFVFNTLQPNRVYTCTLRAQNENGYGYLVLPPFTILESFDGPGGVGSIDGTKNTTLWLKGGEWTANGNNIIHWEDISGSGSDFDIWDGSTATPTVGEFAGLPVASFTGGQALRSVDGVQGGAKAIFIVYKNTSTAANSSPMMSGAGVIHGASTASAITSTEWTATNILNGGNFAQGRNIGNGTSHPRPVNYQVFSHMLAGTSPLSNDFTIGRDRTFADRGIDGGIAELIMYNRDIVKAERIIIENYLAVKFDLAAELGGDHGTARYQHVSHKYDMGGIGQADDGTVSYRGKANIIELNMAGAPGNNKFLMWGHDNAPQSFQADDVPVAEQITSRYSRTWRVANTGVGQVDMTIYLREIPGFMNMCVNGDNFVLLQSATGAFDNSSKMQAQYDANKGTLTINGVNLSSGSYFTLGVGGAGANYFVTPNGSGLRNGSSWADSCSLDGAFNAPRLTGDVIKLKGGEYKPKASYSINAGITVQGGYAGVDEEEVAEPEVNRTIISGDVDNNDGTTNSIVMYHRQIEGNNLSRLFNIANVEGVNLEGFIITGMSQYANHGAAIWQENAKVVYNKMKFYGNRARGVGGAIFAFGAQSQVNIYDSHFEGNVSEHGGAVAIRQGAKMAVENTEFKGNQALALSNRDLSTTGSALKLSGNTQLNLGNNPPSNNFTVEFWAKVPAGKTIGTDYTPLGAGTTGLNNDQRYLFGASHGGDVAAGMGLSLGANALMIAEHGSGYLPIVAKHVADFTSWNHIAIVYSKSGSNNPKAQIYVNGAAVGTSVNSGRATVLAPQTMGANASYNHPDGFHGEIDELRIWDRSLTASEIAEGYYKEIDSPSTKANLVNYWQFNGNSTDIIGNANTTGSGLSYNPGIMPAVSPSWNRYEGGAIDVSQASELTIENSRFYDNSVPQNTVIDNMFGRGGAISLSLNAKDDPARNATKVSISNSEFKNNSAYDGGGAIVAYPGFTSLKIENTLFEGNKTGSTSYRGSGGALMAFGAPTSTGGQLSIIDSTFKANEAPQLGGAIFLAGDDTAEGMNVAAGGNESNYLQAFIERTLFVGNTANHGGAYFSWRWSGNAARHNTVINNATFTKNFSTVYGGALGLAAGAQTEIKHATFYDNTTQAASGGGGGAIYFKGTVSHLDLKNSILLSNYSLAHPASNNLYRQTGEGSIDANYNLVGLDALTGWHGGAALGGDSFTPVAGSKVQEIIVPTLVKEVGEINEYFALSNNSGQGSLAFNRIPMANCLATDQRKHTREVIETYVNCDIGAYETIKIDSDGDGVIDALDNCPLRSNPGQEDLDGDGVGDVCDDDIDGDGIPNELDQYPTINLHVGLACEYATEFEIHITSAGNAIRVPTDCGTGSTPIPGVDYRIDTDGNGMPDECDQACTDAGMIADPDIDGDGLLNDQDNCPFNYNPDQSDIDNDGVGDVCDPDMDGDGIVNEEDNCLAVFNPGQEMSGNNGLGDACNVLFVTSAGRGLKNCSSWENACAGGSGSQLQDVFDQAETDGVARIFMAQGVYRPSAAVKLFSGAQVYGGFAGIKEQFTYEAKPEVNLTVITADTDADDTTDNSGITLTKADQKGNNLGTIFEARALGNGQATLLEGLVFSGASQSAALLVDSSRVRVSYSQFIGNYSSATGVNAGGAINLRNGGKLIIEDVKFINNASVAQGGALYANGSASQVNIEGAYFDSNEAEGHGGALYLNGGSIEADGLIFINNNSKTGSGGALAVENATSFKLSESEFNSNNNSISSSTSEDGGAAMYISNNASALSQISKVRFVGNTSMRHAGALKLSGGGTVNIVDSLFRENTATNGNSLGGAIYISGGTTALVDIERSSFVNNQATSSGAIHITGSGKTMNVHSSTFAFNQATGTHAGAIGIENNATANFTHATLYQNNMAAGNGGAIRATSGTILSLKNSLVLGNTRNSSSVQNINAGGTFTDAGYNIIGFNGASGFMPAASYPASSSTSKIGSASELNKVVKLTLLNYSGLYPSIALVKNSEARDAIPNGESGCVTGEGADERGFARPDRVNPNDTDQEGDVRACDIGAFEFNDAFRLDCYEEDGLRPDGGTGLSLSFCSDGGKTTLPEIADNILGGKVNYHIIGLLLLLGLLRLRGQRNV